MQYGEQHGTEEYSQDVEGFYMSSSPENRMLTHSGNQGGVDYKGTRTVKKIDGPVIPMEYSDPDLQRQSSEFSAILQQATASSSMKRHESTFVMDISPSVVGWIIGRSGIRIKEIQSLTGCKMWVDQDVPNDQPRKIYFHGSKQSIEAAVSRVNELVQAAPILSSNHVAAGKGLTSVIVDCPVSLVGLLIGKRGWTIKKIQQASNAQISINQSVREGLPRKIIVSGDERSVSTALRLITEVLRDKTLIGTNGEHEGHQLSMKMANGSGYPPRDSSMPMRDSSPMPYDQYGIPHQNNSGGGYVPHYGGSHGQAPSRMHQAPTHLMMGSGGMAGQNPTYTSPASSSSNAADLLRDRYSPNPQQQFQQQPAHPIQGYTERHGARQPKRNGNPNSYQQDSNRLFSNQYGQGQQMYDVPIPRRGNGGGYNSRHRHSPPPNESQSRYYSSSPPSADQFVDQQHYQHQHQHHQVMPEPYGKHLQRDESPNAVAITGQPLNSSTIFDFQHRQTSPHSEVDSSVQQEQGQGPHGVAIE